MHWGRGVYEKSLYLPFSFSVKLKLLSKIKSIITKIKEKRERKGEPTRVPRLDGWRCHGPQRELTRCFPASLAASKSLLVSAPPCHSSSSRLT